MAIKVKGLKELSRRFSNIPIKTKQGVRNAMEFIYEESQPLVPVDTGRLKASGTIYENGERVTIIYRATNPDTGYNYAPIQHEHLGYHHNIGQAKYLEEPIRKNIDQIKQIVVKEIIK